MIMDHIYTNSRNRSADPAVRDSGLQKKGPEPSMALLV